MTRRLIEDDAIANDVLEEVTAPRVAVDEPFGTSAKPNPPAREVDLSLGADGLCEASWFWDRLKGVEQSIYREDFGPEWWAVELWLEQPALLR